MRKPICDVAQLNEDDLLDTNFLSAKHRGPMRKYPEKNVAKRLVAMTAPPPARLANGRSKASILGKKKRGPPAG